MRIKAFTATMVCVVCLGVAAPSPAAPIDSAYTSTVYILLASDISPSPSESPSPSVSPSLSPSPSVSPSLLSSPPYADASLSTPAPLALSADSPAPQDAGTGSPLPPFGEPTAAPSAADGDAPSPSASPLTQTPRAQTPPAQTPGTPGETAATADTQPPAPDDSIGPGGTGTPTPTPNADASSLDALLAEEIPAEAPSAGPVETPFAGTVSIRMNAPAQLRMGDTVELTAALEGYDGVSVLLQWQYTRDGVNWTDAQGANGYTYVFTVDTQTAGTGWRLSVTVN